MSVLTKIIATKRFEKKFAVRVMVDGVAKMFHLDANSPRQAKVQAGKRGRVLSVRKVDMSYYTTIIEGLKLDQEPMGLYLGAGLYDSDINLDEALGLRKKKNRNNKDKGNKGKNKK